MATVQEKIQFLQDYLNNPERYLPLVDHAWKVFPDYSTFSDLNFGWDAGLIGRNRPYFCECWTGDGLTVLTYFVSRQGIESYSIKDLEEMLEREKIVWYIGPRKHQTSVAFFTDPYDNEFYSINFIVEDDEGPYIDGGRIYSFEALNEFNKDRNGQRVINQDGIANRN